MNGYWGLQQCKSGLNLDIFILDPLRHKMLARTVLMPISEPETAESYGAVSVGGRPAYS
jgi:hypothetical protein